MFKFFKKKTKKIEKKYTKEEQIEAINKVVEMLNKYDLTMKIEHTIGIIPLEKKE